MPNLLSISPNPVLSVFLLILLLWVVMYFARKPFHRFMTSMGRIIYNGMRLAAASVKLTEKRLKIRNKEVLLNAGLEMAERKVEREFDRIGAAVQRDLEGYPQLQRKLTQDLLKIEEDYSKSAEIPQMLPDWVKVIDAIANIKPTGDRMVLNMLEEIHATLTEQHKAAVEKHRRDVAERHATLSRMLPFWRAVQKTLSGVQRTIAGLGQRSKKIDRYMADYEKIRTQTDMAERQLSCASLNQFFISSTVLAVAVLGAIINFNLVALPFSEMAGGNSSIGEFRASDVAGMLIVCFEIVLGFFLMDALRVTRLFTTFGGMEDSKRVIFIWVFLGSLLLLAGVESALAYRSDQMAAEMVALRQSLAGVQGSEMAVSNIATIGQMIMGFILPFVLTFVAIPFESFIASSRTVIGILSAWGLSALAFVLRLLGNLGFYAARMLINLYDLVAFAPLWLEGMLLKRTARAKPEQGPAIPAEQENLDISPLMEADSRNKEVAA